MPIAQTKQNSGIIDESDLGEVGVRWKEESVADNHTFTTTEKRVAFIRYRDPDNSKQLLEINEPILTESGKDATPDQIRGITIGILQKMLADLLVEKYSGTSTDVQEV